MEQERIKALVIDDEPDICDLLKITLAKMDIDAQVANNVTGAKTLLAKEAFQLCLTDMRLPDGDGIEIVKYVQDACPQTPIAVITAFGNVELAVSALKAGAFDFVSKPIDLTMLRHLVQQAVKLSSSTEQPVELADKGLLGGSLVMRDLAKKIKKLARSQAPVHISGESGTGKELAAHLIHSLGPRAEQPFIPVNCGAIPEHLMESEFFGHKKGSFTGAEHDKNGLFQAAQGGTLFLDEVADLPIHMQVKLLRAIQEKSIRPVGAQQEVAIDVRILSATHRNLHRLVKEGSFRQDLFYRINVIELVVPTLRERIEDMPEIANYIVDKIAKRSDEKAPVITDEAIALLNHYSFPGNIRELENILERATTMCESFKITAKDLALEESKLANQSLESTIDVDIDTDMPLEPYMDKIEKSRIVDALEKTHWNKTRAAKLLGITLRALRYRMEKLGLE